MKRRFWRFALLIISVLALAFLVAILLESGRPIVSAEEFTSRMEEAGYAVEDKTHLLEQVEVYLVADCGVFYVEFMVHETMADARLTFRRLRSDLEQVGDILAFTWSSSGFNSWYSQITSDRQIGRIIRVRNTIIFVSTTEENAINVADVLEMLGQQVA